MNIRYIYLYETRNLDFLHLLIIRLKNQGFIPVLLDDSTGIQEDLKFKSFLSTYQHFSDNPFDFEVNCFARYFAILEKHKTIDEPFIIADTDIFTSRNLNKVINYKNNNFYGSAGYDMKGAEDQISPHFSMWNYDLLQSFVDFICNFYAHNANSAYIKDYYEKRKQRLGRTGISDMTLLHDWVLEKNISFINTNKATFDFIIDHNISAHISEDCQYIQSWGRKKVIFEGDKTFFMLKDKSNNVSKKEVHVMHFQGRYKKTLVAVYEHKYSYFMLYSVFIWVARKIRKKLFSTN